jgi:Papain family cysteine protease
MASKSSAADYVPPTEEDDTSSSSSVPAAVDWVERGAVTSVKDQGRCGGCWSISITGAIEGAAAISNNYLQSLSFQQLISCDESNLGCDGGFPASALAYANNNLEGGTATLNDYPYTDGELGETTQECQIADKNIAVNSQQGRAITYYGAVGDDTYDLRMQKMKQGLARQPIAVAVKSDCTTWTNYRSGVVTDDGDCACLPSMTEPCLDHAVLLVGYNDDYDPAYWKIKNSWGTGWGEDGYIRIAQFNPHTTANSWGLFGVLAEGVVPLQAVNQTSQVYDESQDVGMETWEKLCILLGAFVAAACLGVGLVRCKNRICAKNLHQEPSNAVM